MATKAHSPARTRRKPAAEVPNAFIGWPAAPGDADLAKALGPAKPVWEELICGLASRHEVATQEWRCYSPKAGWALRLLRGKRTIVWLAPCNGCFRVAFILGDKALGAAKLLQLSARVRKALDEAVRYPEGNGIRLIVAKPEDLPALEKLAVAKIEN
jgi:hypothetical protein